MPLLDQIHHTDALSEDRREPTADLTATTSRHKPKQFVDDYIAALDGTNNADEPKRCAAKRTSSLNYSLDSDRAAFYELRCISPRNCASAKASPYPTRL
jgi:hypothetical protein